MGSICIGVDVGQKIDPTAIAVVESEQRSVAGRSEAYFTVRYLERLPLGTPYPEVATAIAAIVRGVRQLAAKGAPLSERISVNPHTGGGQIQRTRLLPPMRLYADATGVGQPVIDLLKQAGVPVIACYFTHGDRRVVKEGGEVSLGKGWLVSRLKALLQTGRLKAPRSPEATALVQELLDYEIRVDENANDKYGAFRVGSHDDLVTALGLACQVEPPRPFSSASAGPRPQYQQASLSEQQRLMYMRNSYRPR